MLDSTDLPQAAAALEQCIGVLGDAVDPGLRADLEGQAREAVSRGDWCRLPYGCPVRWCVQVGPLGHALHSSTAACTSTTTMHEFQGPGYCCVLYVLIDAACCLMCALIDACCVLIKIHTLLCAGRFARIRWRPICRYMRHSRQHFQLAAPCDGPRSS